MTHLSPNLSERLHTDFHEPVESETLGGRLHGASHESKSTGIVQDAPAEPETTSEFEDTVAHGKSPATPFMLLGGVAAAVWSAVAVISLAALLIWWLV